MDVCAVGCRATYQVICHISGSTNASVTYKNDLSKYSKSSIEQLLKQRRKP